MTSYTVEISEIQLYQIELLKGLLETGKCVQLKSSGNSMYPIIQSNDLLIFRSSKKLDYRRGDVVVFQRGHQLVCHRIKRILPNDRLETQGDSCIQSDGEVSKTDILGVVINGGSNAHNLKLSKSLSNLFGQAYNIFCHFLLKIKFQKDKFQEK
jgi:signal peptidase I